MEKERLAGKRVAILATNGFEFDELSLPRKALEQAGAKVTIVSLEKGEIKGWKNGNWAGVVEVDQTLDKVDTDDFDALMLPGGPLNPDKLRLSQEAVEFVRKFDSAKKPIAAICHAPSILIEADIVRNRQLTSWPSIRTDLINAGAQWVNSEVVVDDGLVTSRRPSDIPAFNQKMIEQFGEGIHTLSVEQAEAQRLAPRH
jgi:protease I